MRTQIGTTANIPQFTPQVTALFTNPITQNQSNFNTTLETDLLNEKSAKSILSLVKWFDEDPTLLKEVQLWLNNSHANQQASCQVESIAHDLYKLVNFKKIPNMKETLNGKFNLNNDYLPGSNNPETFLGDLIDLSTVISPKQAKTWYELANWCYKWGKKSADKIQLNFSNSTSENSELNFLFKDLPAHTTTEEKDYIISIFSQGLNLINLVSVVWKENDDDVQRNDVNKEGFLAETRAKLIGNCSSLTASCIDGLLQVWQNIVNRVYHFHRIACRSYFTYLNLSTHVIIKRSIKSNSSLIHVL